MRLKVFPRCEAQPYDHCPPIDSLGAFVKKRVVECGWVCLWTLLLHNLSLEATVSPTLKSGSGSPPTLYSPQGFLDYSKISVLAFTF